MLIDSHCHLPHKKYEKPIEEILLEAQSVGVEKFIDIGTSLEESKKVVELANKYSQVYCSIGVYPHEDMTYSIEEIFSFLEEIYKTSDKIVAVGECGVDISNRDGGRVLEEQVELFEKQVNFAKSKKLPIIVHNRRGDEYVLDVLKKNYDSDLKGVIHCFDSNWDFAKKVLDLGFYISFTNMVTYKNKEDLLDVVEKVPEDRFLVETDAPYLPPQQFRGEINYPKYVKIVAEKVAQVKQKTFEDISALSYSNTCSLFNL
jgi:TatD DNase family protein